VSFLISYVADDTPGETVTSGLVTQFTFMPVPVPPEIIAHPQSQTLIAGTPATFDVRVRGTKPLSYQWRFNGSDIAGATGTNAFILGVQTVDAGDYTVVITNEFGSVTSTVATLTVNYSLTVHTNGNGQVFNDPNLVSYAPNSTVTLTAIPTLGYALLRWSGDDTGRSNPLDVVMTANKAITANFVSTVLYTPIQGEGTVTKNPDRPFYDIAEQVTLTATASRWYAFSQWGDGVTATQRVVTIGTSNTYAAVFSPTTALERLEFAGVARIAPVGTPAVFVDGIFVVVSNVSVRASVTVSLLTTFSNGLLLYSLDGSDPSVSARLYGGPFVLSKSATLRAIAYNADFTQSAQCDPVEIAILPTLSPTTTGGGSVAMHPSAGAYLSNGTAVVTATPAPGWTFLHWLGDETGTFPVASVSMSRNKCVQAVFGTALSNTVVGSGSVVRSPAAALYPYETAVRLTAVPQAGNYFALWGNAASGTNNPLTFTVTNANPTVTAVFALLLANQHALTVLPGGFGQVSTSPTGNRFTAGASVTLTAAPDAGQQFLGWSGDAGGTQNPLTVVMNASKVITAQFTRRPQLTPLLCGGAANGVEIQLLLTGEFGERYSIEATTSFALPPAATAWTPLATGTNLFGAAQFNDPFVANRTQRFYRATVAAP